LNGRVLKVDVNRINGVSERRQRRHWREGPTNICLDCWRTRECAMGLRKVGVVQRP